MPSEVSSSPKSWPKEIAKRLFAIVFGLVLVWLMLEVFVRVGFDLLPTGSQAVVQHVRRVPWDDEHIIPIFPWGTSREFQARLPPDLKNYRVHWGDANFTFNTISLWGGSEGFRTAPPQWPVDIAAVGDSFTFCWTSFEECWVERLHQDFGWSVMNLGIPGTGSTSHQYVAGVYVPPLEPKVVVWQWFGNDYQDDYDHARIRGTVDLLSSPPGAQPDPTFDWFADYSAVYRLVRDWLHRRAHPPLETSINVKVNGREMALNTLQKSHDLTYPSAAYGFELSIQAIQDSYDQAAAIGAEFVIVLLPTKEECYAAKAPQLDADYVQMLIKGRERLLDVCEERNWRCVDMFGPLQNAVNAGKTVYNAFDFHLDAVGNQIVAEELAHYLTENGLLESGIS